MRWHYRDPWLAWLLPLAYGLHVLEEWFGGFPEWVAQVVGSPLPRDGFIVVNAIAMVLAVAATRAATAREDYGWAGIAVATVLFVNAFSHMLGTAVTRSYSPGLLTAVVLYLPIAGLVLLRAGTQAAPAMFRRGLIAGFALHALVFVVAFLLTR